MTNNKILLKFYRLIGEVQRYLGFTITFNVTPRLALEKWIKDFTIKYPNKNEEILISAFRNQTWIEWAVYSAFVYKQMGYNPSIIYRSSETNLLYPETNPYFNFIEGVKLIKWITLIDIDILPRNYNVYNEILNSSDKDFFSALAYDFHIESETIQKNITEYSKPLSILKENSAIVASAIDLILTNKRYKRFILFSGIIGYSRSALEIGIKNNQIVVCVEGWSWRPGHVIYNYNAPALEYNIKGWKNNIGVWDEFKEKEIMSYLTFLNGGKVEEPGWLDNFNLIQKSRVEKEIKDTDLKDFLKGDDPIALLAPNVIGDSSLLDRDTIFPSIRSWLFDVLSYFENNPSLKLIIRVHPAESTIPKGKLRVKISEIFNEYNYKLDNVFLIDSNNPINTFSLLPFVSFGLVWISSVGVDLVLRGIPVIAAASAKYSGLGIVEEPNSKEVYFKLITDYFKERKYVNSNQIQAAKEYQYVVFKGFSFPAQSPNYRASGCNLNNMAYQEDHDRFYKILVGEITPPDQTNE